MHSLRDALFKQGPLSDENMQLGFPGGRYFNASDKTFLLRQNDPKLYDMLYGEPVVPTRAANMGANRVANSGANRDANRGANRATNRVANRAPSNALSTTASALGITRRIMMNRLALQREELCQ